jgi:hypothetical protein
MAKALTAHSDSNAAKPAGHADETGGPGELGYTREPYPTEGPAETNHDIGQLTKSEASLGNDGTSRNSYKIQSDEPNAMSGTTGTGN